jgi:hypothetical protein
MGTILSLLQTISATASKLEKRAIIKENENDLLFRRVCQMAYAPSLSYYINRPSENVAHFGGMSLVAGLDLLLSFTKGNCRGNEQKALLLQMLQNLIPADAEVICRILDRDLASGFGEKSCNATWPGLISTFDFLLADTDPTSIVYPALSQLKADGIRAKMHISAEMNRVTFISRQGKPIELFDFFDQEGIALVFGKTSDLDGELICYNGDGTPMSRKVSNGILNKAIKGTISREEASVVRFVCWDLDDPAGKWSYVDRFRALEKQFIEQKPKRIMLIETILVSNRSEALDHFKQIRRRGLEGTIVKNLEGKWVPKRSKDLCKFKAEIEGEFKVVGFEFGTGKNKHRVGALNIESADGLIKSKVGIFKDMDEKVRDEWVSNTPEIVTVLYNERITDKSRKDGTESLFLPRVTAVRLDKNTANTRAELIAIEEAILE